MVRLSAKEWGGGGWGTERKMKATNETGAQLQRRQQHSDWTHQAEGDCNLRLTRGFTSALPVSLSLSRSVSSLLWWKFKRLSRGYFPQLVQHFKMLLGTFSKKKQKWLKNVDDTDCDTLCDAYQMGNLGPDLDFSNWIQIEPLFG